MFAHPVILAHQGGWDEMLLIAVPIALFGGLLWIANRRASAAGDGDVVDGDGSHDTTMGSDAP